MTAAAFTLAELGFSAPFMMQLDLEEVENRRPVRISEVQRNRLTGLGQQGEVKLHPPAGRTTGTFGVGDWVLLDAQDRIVRRLERQTELTRRAAGTDATTQIIAANVDTLFIVTSCNADFSPARLERYLALAADSGVTPVLLLTKADLIGDSASYAAAARDLMVDLDVQALNATDPKALDGLGPWCGSGQTVALVGSSGVGKTTILNGLTGGRDATRAIREDDAKGRHTTTYRALRPLIGGGWIIDTPGMRALRLHDKAEGIDAVFDDIAALARRCRFNDCRHETEPGCAVVAAIEAGSLDGARLKRWQKLLREDSYNSETIAESRKRNKEFGKMVQRVQSENKARKGH